MSLGYVFQEVLMFSGIASVDTNNKDCVEVRDCGMKNDFVNT